MIYFLFDCSIIFNINMLSDELWGLILSNIKYTRISKLKLVCKQFKRVIDSDYFENIHLDYKVLKKSQTNIDYYFNKFKRERNTIIFENSVLYSNKKLCVEKINYGNYGGRILIKDLIKNNWIDILDKLYSGDKWIYLIICSFIKYENFDRAKIYLNKLNNHEIHDLLMYELNFSNDDSINVIRYIIDNELYKFTNHDLIKLINRSYNKNSDDISNYLISKLKTKDV